MKTYWMELIHVRDPHFLMWGKLLIHTGQILRCRRQDHFTQRKERIEIVNEALPIFRGYFIAYLDSCDYIL